MYQRLILPNRVFIINFEYFLQIAHFHKNYAIFETNLI